MDQNGNILGATPHFSLLKGTESWQPKELSHELRLKAQGWKQASNVTAGFEDTC